MWDVVLILPPDSTKFGLALRNKTGGAIGELAKAARQAGRKMSEGSPYTTYHRNQVFRDR
jgi:hypothetical protein